MSTCFPPQRVSRGKGPSVCSTHRRKGIRPAHRGPPSGEASVPALTPLPSRAASETLYELGSALEMRTYSFR